MNDEAATLLRLPIKRGPLGSWVTLGVSVSYVTQNIATFSLPFSAKLAHQDLGDVVQVVRKILTYYFE